MKERLATMTLFGATVTSLALFGQPNAPAAASGKGTPMTMTPKDSQTVQVTRSGSQPPTRGAAEHFTGSVRIDPLFPANDPLQASGGLVSFDPGARTAWHTHPRGQVLIVTSGTGWVQQWGGPIQEIRQGDVVRIPPGQKHWHGATAITAMSHIALTEQVDGKVVDWMEKVTDEQYLGASRPRGEQK